MTSNKKREEEIKNYMMTLQISKEEAEQLWEDDNSDELTPEQIELGEKAKKNIKNYTQSEKSHNKGKKKERKIDIEKLEILQQVQALIGGEIENEVALHFSLNGSNFTFKLTRHHKQKTIIELA